MKDWTEFGLRGLPSLSARTRPAALPPFLQPIFDAAAASLARPLVGISSHHERFDHSSGRHVRR
jgi:hypothetical protein